MLDVALFGLFGEMNLAVPSFFAFFAHVALTHFPHDVSTDLYQTENVDFVEIVIEEHWTMFFDQ